MKTVLHYAAPAGHFNEALPLSNGRLVAMVYGGVREECIHLNEDSLWSGVGLAEIPPQARAAQPETSPENSFRLLRWFSRGHRHEVSLKAARPWSWPL